MKSLSKKTITITSIFLLLFIVGELCLRYFLGLANAPLYYASHEYEYIDGETFNSGFDELLDIAHKTGIPLIVELHADASELAKGVYNEQGQEIIDWAKVHDVPLIKELDHAFTKEDYRDGIHLSAKGQRKVAGLMMREIGGIDLLQFRLSKIILRDSK